MYRSFSKSFYIWAIYENHQNWPKNEENVDFYSVSQNMSKIQMNVKSVLFVKNWRDTHQNDPDSPYFYLLQKLKVCAPKGTL